MPDDLVTWLPFAVIAALQVARRHKFEAIVSTSPDHSSHLIALILSKLLHCVWVADFQDPWITNPSSFYPTRLHQRINLMLERLVVTHAHQVVTVSEVWRDDFIKQYPDLNKDKFQVIANGFDPDDFADTPTLIRSRTTIQIVHNGTFFYYNKNPFPFLQAVKLLADTGKLTDVEICFVGVPVDKLSPVIQEMQLDPIVKLVEQLPHQESLKYVKSADILLLIAGSERGVLTAKVYEYLATLKPILALTPTSSLLAHLLNQAKVAELVDPSSPQSIAAGLSKLIDRVCTSQLPTPNCEFIRQFSRRDQTRLLATYLDQALTTQTKSSRGQHRNSP
jgi:glycosyltransferase involved in cell wall biosynthesis